jgi:hypothetical protein
LRPAQRKISLFGAVNKLQKERERTEKEVIPKRQKRKKEKKKG